MKKVIVSAFLLGSVTTSAMAQTAQPAQPAATAPQTAPAKSEVKAPVTSATVQNVQTAATAPKAAVAPADAKTKVDPTALPEAVKKTLATSEYKDWKVVDAWLVKTPTEHYSLQLKKDEKSTATFNVDKDGKVVKS